MTTYRIQLIENPYYKQLWVGSGTPAQQVDANSNSLFPKLDFGAFYMDVSSSGKGKLYAYDGVAGSWTELE